VAPLPLQRVGRDTTKWTIRRSDRHSLERFNSDAVVDRAADSLLTAEILFCCLNGDVPEEKLDLVKFTTCCMAEAGARPPVMPNAA
jgi:hypothetical protein